MVILRPVLHSSGSSRSLKYINMVDVVCTWYCMYFVKFMHLHIEQISWTIVNWGFHQIQYTFWKYRNLLSFFPPQATLLYNLLGSKSVSPADQFVPDWSYKLAPLLTVIPMVCIPIFLFISLGRVSETHQSIQPICSSFSLHSSHLSQFHLSQHLPSMVKYWYCNFYTYTHNSVCKHCIIKENHNLTSRIL